MENEEPEIEFQFLVKKTKDGQVLMTPLDEETKPNTLDDVWLALSILNRNIEAQHVAATVHQTMMQAAMQMSGEQTAADGKIIIPQNKNIR